MSKNKYKDAYHSLLENDELRNRFPTMCGNYKVDKKSWKMIYDADARRKSQETSDGTTTTVVLNKVQPSLENEKFLMDYLNTHSPSGCEHEAQKVWTSYVDQYVDKMSYDVHGNVVAKKDSANQGSGFKPFTLMIEAHCDEISYIITKIEPNGLIYVMRNGGSDEAIAPSKKVLIHVSNRKKVSAIFGWIAIHIREPNIKPDRNTIFLDAGFNSYDEVKAAGIQVGQYVTYDEEASILNDKVIGKSLDNKVGGYIIAEVMRKLAPLNLDIEVLASNSVQEEVGLHGAEMVAARYTPDAVIVTDVCHDTSTPGIVNKLIGDIHIGKGPVLLRGAAVHGRFTKIMENMKIPHQIAACSGRGTGTDADVFTYANGGTPTTLIKMPLKYMHTTVEMVSITDINNAIDMMYETVIYVDSFHKNNIFEANDFDNDLE